MSKKKAKKPSKEETEWLASGFAMLFLLRAVHQRSDLAGNETDEEWRAIAVKVTTESSGGGFVLPGTRVDVVCTTRTVNLSRRAAH